MKSIIYILLIVFIGGIVVSAFPIFTSKPHYLVKIQTVEKNPATNLLTESCSIIKNRLNDYGLKKFGVSVATIPNTIEISFTDSADIREILPLLISKGKFEMYETLAKSAVIKRLQKDDQLFSLLNIGPETNASDSTSPVLAFCKMQNKSEVEAYITMHNLSSTNEGTRYLLSVNSNKDGDYYLIMVKYPAAMQKFQLAESSVEKGPTATDHVALMIKFNQSGTSEWANLTKSNIGKSLAMVIDNKVYSAPRVMAEIKGGSCQITGNFTLKEITCLKSLINNAELPLPFELIR